MNVIFNENDIILLTETWSSDVFNYDVQNFKFFVVNREFKSKGAKRNSGGIIVYIRDSLCKHVEFIKKTEDCILWLKIDKSLFDAECDILLCLAYNTPQGSSREVFYSQSIFDIICTDMIEINKTYE